MPVPPAKVCAPDAPPKTMVDVSPIVVGLVKPVIVAIFHVVAAAVEFIVQVPEPISRVRALLLLESNDPAVTFLVSASSVPEVRVTVLSEPNVTASCNTTAPVVVPAIVIPPQVPEVVSVPMVRLIVAVAGGLSLSVPV